MPSLTDSEPSHIIARFLKSHSVLVLLRASALVLMLVHLYYVGTRSPTVTHGFTMYYVYARILVDDIEFAKVYDYEFFNQKVQDYGISGIKDMPNNLPTNAFVLAPLAFLPASQAKMVLGGVSAIASIASLLILLNVYGVPLTSPTTPLVAIVFFLWRPLYENIFLGQIYALILLMFALSLLGLRKGNPVLTSVPVCTALLSKGYGIVPMMWMAVRKNWTALVALCLSLLLLLGITLPFIGFGSWIKFANEVLPTLGTLPSDAHTAFQTINSLVFHLFTRDSQWLPNPIVEIPVGVLRIVSYALNLGLIIYLLRLAHGSGPHWEKVTYSAAIAGGVLTAPLAEEYHFILFLPVVVGVIASLVERFLNGHSPRVLDVICLLAICLLAAPLGYKDFQFARFPLILLGYPKLCIGIVLLVCVGRMIKRSIREKESNLVGTR